MNVYRNAKPFCFLLTSGPGCGDSSGWQGQRINLYQNGHLVTVVPRQFTEFQFCLQDYQVNVTSDEFQLLSTGNDGVSCSIC